ncbi:MAG: hypothetical protein NVS3B27_21600 [Novosphingobium sp.]
MHFALASVLALGAINQRPAPAPRLIETYGTASPHQTDELRLPQGASKHRGPFPVTMLVHGGCWTAGLGSRGGWPGTFADWVAIAPALLAAAAGK